MKAEDELVFECQYCGQINTVWVDLTVDTKQDFIEECCVCSYPNRIIITKDKDENVFIEALQIDG